MLDGYDEFYKNYQDELLTHKIMYRYIRDIRSSGMLRRINW